VNPGTDPLDVPPFPDDGASDVMAAWADAWVAAEPSSIQADLASGERAHLNLFMQQLGRGLGQFYAEYGALVRAIDDVNVVEREHWPPFRYVQFVLLAKNLSALHSAMDRLSRGFHQDALSLIRSSYEAWLRAVFISCYPSDPYAVLVRRPPKGVPAFNATDLVRTQLRLEWGTKYRIMSGFAHGNSIDSIESLEAAVKQDGVPERFGLVVSYRAERIELAFPLLEFVVLLYLRFVTDRLLGSQPAPTPGVAQRSSEAVALLQRKFRDHPKPYWRNTMEDLDYVHELLGVADRGEDWRAIRDRRPIVSDDRSTQEGGGS
jgi:hypothetical protein